MPLNCHSSCSLLPYFFYFCFLLIRDQELNYRYVTHLYFLLALCLPVVFADLQKSHYPFRICNCDLVLFFLILSFVLSPLTSAFHWRTILVQSSTNRTYILY